MNVPLYYAKFYKIFQAVLQMQLTRPTLKRFVLLTLGVYGAKSFIISEVARQLLSSTLEKRQKRIDLRNS